MAVLAGPATLETNDLTQFSATGIATGATRTAQAASAKNGTYGLRISDTDTTDVSDTTFVRLNFTNPASNIVVTETWFRIVTQAAGDIADVPGLKAIASIGDASDNRMCWIGIRRAAGASQLRLVYRSKAGTDTTVATVGISNSTWYLVRLMRDNTGANPVATGWYSTDGVTMTQIGTVTDSSSGADGMGRTPARARWGQVHMNNFLRTDWAFDFDDLTVYDAIPVADPFPLPRRLMRRTLLAR